jgi:hypothetical protein
MPPPPPYPARLFPETRHCRLLAVARGGRRAVLLLGRLVGGRGVSWSGIGRRGVPLLLGVAGRAHVLLLRHAAAAPAAAAAVAPPTLPGVLAPAGGRGQDGRGWEERGGGRSVEGEGGETWNQRKGRRRRERKLERNRVRSGLGIAVAFPRRPSTSL